MITYGCDLIARGERPAKRRAVDQPQTSRIVQQAVTEQLANSACFEQRPGRNELTFCLDQEMSKLRIAGHQHPSFKHGEPFSRGKTKKNRVRAGS